MIILGSSISKDKIRGERSELLLDMPELSVVVVVHARQVHIIILNLSTNQSTSLTL
jgi:hypothetical protein